MPDPFKFQRALFPELEPRTILARKAPDARLHRCTIIWANQATDEIRAKTRGMNSGLFVSVHESQHLFDAEELTWEAGLASLPKWF
jgi:hypothetical protein